MKRVYLYGAVALVGIALISAAIPGPSGKRMELSPVQADSLAPLFINDIVSVPGMDGAFVTTNKGDRSVRVYSPTNTGFQRPWFICRLDQIPTGVAISAATGQEAGAQPVMYVTTFETRGLLEVVRLLPPAERGDEVGAVRSIPVGSGATSPVVGVRNGREVVYVLNQFAGTVVEVDPEAGTILRTVSVLREPKGAVISKNGQYLFVTNFLPSGQADQDIVAACVSVIDLSTFKKVKDIQLANGSNALRGIALTADGKYVLISHNLGRFMVPTSQLYQGWMNTSALSVIDAEKLEFRGSIVLDEPERGAAGVWDIKTTPEHIFVTHSGTHELSVINYPDFIAKLNAYKGTTEELSYDLRFMYGQHQRIPLHGNGPRKMALNLTAATGTEAQLQLLIPTYFSDTMNIVNLSSDGNFRLGDGIAMVQNRQESVPQQGERIFNDAHYCFQQWQSCNGCHPGDARTDGMNWDLMNDSIGNPKNCKSLLLSHVTPPSMISGIRAMAEIAVRKGFEYIQFFTIPEEEAVKVDQYLRSLRPVPSPYLVDGQLSEKAQLGRKVFDRLGCGECHSGPNYTDMQMHRIGQDVEFIKGWDTPTLREVWRTAPYLFDGRAATMRDVFAAHHHGIDPAVKVSAKEIDQLTEYVNSL